MNPKIKAGQVGALVVLILALTIFPNPASAIGGCAVVGGFCQAIRDCSTIECSCDFDAAGTCTCICIVGPAGGRTVCGPSSLTALGIRLLSRPASSLLNGPELLAAIRLPSAVFTAGTSAPYRGAYVDSVVRGGPADRAGLQQGDVVLRVGQTPITGANKLNTLLLATEAGQPVELNFSRAGVLHTARLTVADPSSVLPMIRVPFIASIVEERRWTQNGISFHESRKLVQYRDSMGRQATEEVSPQPGGAVRHTAHVFDPVKGVNISIDHQGRTAVVLDSRWRKGYARRKAPQVLEWSEHPSVYLGSKVIEGLRCEGYRTEMVLENPAQLGIVSSAPLVFRSEIWLSDLTLSPILETDEDPLRGSVETRMVDLRLNVEPQKTVFEVPAGYQLRERPFSDFWVPDETQPRGPEATGGAASQ